MNAATQTIIDKYYPEGNPLRVRYLSHCRAVARKALDIAAAKHLDLDPEMIETAAMLHDIGIVMTDAPGIDCRGTEPYIRHGILGAELLRREGAPEWAADVAERHTGAGLTADDIAARNLPLPHTDLLPRTLLERLICYADKYYSKSGSPDGKTLDQIRITMSRFGAASLERFEALHREFA